MRDTLSYLGVCLSREPDLGRSHSEPRPVDKKPTGRYCYWMGPDRTRQERAERTRAHIVETAAVAFAAHGFDGVSLNDLIAESGLSKGAFYFHFSSKQDIALAAFRAKQEQFVSLLAAQTAPKKAADRAAFILRRRAQLLREDPSLGCVTRLGSYFNERSAPGSVYASYLDERVAAIAGLVAEGQREGQFRADLDARGAARAIFASVIGVDTLSHLSSGGKDLEARTDELIDVLSNGLIERGTRPQSTVDAVPDEPAYRGDG